MSIEIKDYYFILAIDKNSNTNQIWNSYQNKTKKYRTEGKLYFTNNSDEYEYLQYSIAYKVLSDKENRILYDNICLNKSLPITERNKIYQKIVEKERKIILKDIQQSKGNKFDGCFISLGFLFVIGVGLYFIFLGFFFIYKSFEFLKMVNSGLKKLLDFELGFLIIAFLGFYLGYKILKTTIKDIRDIK